MILIFLFACSTSAGEVYRYQDENGKWHFTDDKRKIKSNKAEVYKINPINLLKAVDDGKKPVVFVPNNICTPDRNRKTMSNNFPGGHLGKKGKFHVTSTGPDDNPTIFAKNDYFVPITLKYWLEESINMHTNPKLPLTVEVKPHSKLKVVELSRNELYGGWKYRTNYKSQFGTLNPTHDADCYYLPPVPAGRSFRITQAFNGKFSHSGSYNQYAVDIAMPLGTDVLAARAGIIFQRITDYVLNGQTEEIKRKSNVLRIMHSDGSIAIYAHLQFRSMNFYVGDVVKAGQVIGKSGNTGFSTGPHLHFGIHSNIRMVMKSIPFQFFIDGHSVTPKAGMILEAEALKDEQVAN